MKKKVSIKKEKLFLLITISLGLFVGVTIWMVAIEGYRPSIIKWVVFCYKNIGITIVAFIPLVFFAIKTILFDRHDGLTLAYIGNQAKDLGFLGTIIGVMIMFAGLSAGFKSGEAGAVQQAISGFAQAATTTAIGLIIAMICKHFQYRSISKEQTAEVEA